MRILSSLFALLVPFAASANTPITNPVSSSTSVADGSVYVQSSQYNPMFGSQLPNTVVGKDFSSCPGTQLSVAAMPTYNHGTYNGHNEGVTVGLSLNMPLDWEGNISRCRDMQKAQTIKLETENITNIVGACMEARRQGFVLDPKVIPWARYCEGIKHEHPSASYLKARNDMLVDRVDHVEKHHFGKKVTHKH